MGNIKRYSVRPEAVIQADLIEFLGARGWLVEHTHGNLYQVGFPDLYLFHKTWGERWVDCKVKGRYSFTNAQKVKWPLWESFGVGIWILTAASDDEYAKLFTKPNWRVYWKKSWGELPSVDELMAELVAQRKQELESRKPGKSNEALPNG